MLSEREQVQEQYKEVSRNVHEAAIKAGYSVSPQLLPVSKGQSVEKIKYLYEVGCRDFAENYVQELIEKKKALNECGMSDVRFHFIGHLQSNKAKLLFPYVSEVQTIDSLKLARILNDLCVDGSKLKVWVQLNVDDQPTKYGFTLNQLAQALPDLLQLESLDVQGFMAIPDPEKNTKESFERVHDWGAELKASGYEGSIKYSLGMSSDYLEAIQVGTDCVRVGTAIFGKRS